MTKYSDPPEAALDALKAMLDAGPMNDIVRADEARALVELVGTHAAMVDASPFAPTFVVLQTYAKNEFVLALTRLFDRPRRNYTLRSLPAIVEYIDANADSLPVREPSFVQSALEQLGLKGRGLEADSDATRIVMAGLRQRMPSPETHPALGALKALRDKWLAHPEDIKPESIPRTAWASADELLRTGQLMLTAIGGLTSTAYADSGGNYFLTSDAQRTSVATHRLMRHLGIAPPVEHEVELANLRAAARASDDTT